MAEIPGNSRLFRKPDPPKKVLDKRFGSAKLISENGKRTSEPGKRAFEVAKRPSEIAKRASEIDDRKKRSSVLPSKRNSFDHDAAPSDSPPEGAFVPPFEDSPPLAILSPTRRLSSSQGHKPPKSKTSKPPSAPSKPLASQRRVMAQPGRDVTGSIRRTSVGEGELRPGSRRSSVTRAEETALDELLSAKNGVEEEKRGLAVPGPEESAENKTDVYSALIDHARDYIEAEAVPPLLSPPEPTPGPTAHAPPVIEARMPADVPVPVENRAFPLAAPATVYESSAGLEKVVVAVRVRPLTERERASQTRQAVVIQGPKITLYEEAISRAHSQRAPEQGAEGARARANRPAESALPPGAQEFTFDLVQNDSELKENGVPRAKAELQEALFQALGQQCLNSALEGYNVTMFAYGQTGAGKSFSMMGDSSEEGAGIIPRMASKLLQRLREKRDAGTDDTLQVTYLEIYREHVRDLLASTRAPPSYFQDNDSERDESDDGSEPGSDSEANSARGGRPRAPSLRVMVQAKLAAQRFVKRARKTAAKPSAATRFWKAPGEEGDVTVEDDVGSDVASVAGSDASVEAPVRSGQTKGVSEGARGALKIREHPDKGPYVEGLTERHVSSWAEMAQLLEEGSKNRTIAATDMNKVSSRSHTVFTLTLTQTKASEETGVPYQRVSKINLVDLAGSERQNRTNATGARLKESGFINKSLSLLNDVITELARGSDFVPYRNSSLTWLLKESLGGNSKTVMVASISPAEKDVKETLSTLRYANRAKRIKNKPVLNEDLRETLIKALRAEIDSLRAVMQTMAVTGALAVPGSRSPTVQLEKVAQILSEQVPGESSTRAEAAIADGPSTEVVNEITGANRNGLTESAFMLAHSMPTRRLDGVDSVPDSPTSSMLTPVEGFSPRGDTWETVTAYHYHPVGRPHASTWADPARGFEGCHVGVRLTSPRAKTGSMGVSAQLEERKKPDLWIRTRRSGSQSDDEGAHVDSATETDPLPATATEGTETEPDSRPAIMTEGTETESDLLPVSVEEGTETESEPRPVTASQGTETDPGGVPVRVTEGTETEASALAVSTGSDAFVTESVSEGTEAGPGAETAACSTETLPPPELLTEGTGTEPSAEVAAAWTETVPPDVTTEGTDPLPLDVAREGTEMDPPDVTTEGTETDPPAELKSISVETERQPAMLDEGTGCDVEWSDAQNGTERIILCDSTTAMDRVEVISSWTETVSDGVNTLTDTDGLVICVSTASGECSYAVNAESATDVVDVANVGTLCETVQTSSSYTETEAPATHSVASETEPEPEVEKRIVHASAPSGRRFEGFSSAVSSASPFLVQLLVGSDHKQPETENGTQTDLLEDSASNRKLVAGLRVLRQLGIAVDESVLFREAVGEGLTAHALEAEEGGGRGLKASWAVHVLAPGVNSIGSDPASGFKLPGGLAKEHVEMVLAPPSEGKASNATVIVRSIHDAPALLNGMPLPRFAELRNGDCLLLGDPSALGDGSGDAALFYFFNPLCNLPALATSVVSPKTFSPPGTPFPARARAGWTPVGSPSDHESWRSELKSPLGVLLRPLDVRPHGQEVATWSPADGPMLDVGTWAFIMGDELQRSGSVSNETVNAFLEDVRMPSFAREPVARDPPPVSPVKLPQSTRCQYTFTHKVAESPHRSPSNFSGHHPRGMFH